MKDIKNYLIAILAGLLVLTLSTHSAQSAPKQYDAVKLAEYSTCLNGIYDLTNLQKSADGRLSRSDIDTDGAIYQCRLLRP
ncbi:unannotated protein [freshwater metagenome]|uniref:Unannotated protein n=1 Tax=freshwater metagenome TaxID=449393 RepID=A0A6J6UFD3_9ZZZZ|nr:hypothetical protein [Actinomycetota bacterium]